MGAFIMNDIIVILFCILELIIVVPAFLLILVLFFGAVHEMKDFLKW